MIYVNILTDWAGMTELSDRELTIMTALWGNGSMTADEIRADLPVRLDNSTVRTFLRILERKGHITHRKRGRRFVFEARTSREQAVRHAVGGLLDRYFDGSMAALLEWSGIAAAPQRSSGPRRAKPTKRRPAKKPPPRATAQPEPSTPEPPATGPPDDAPWLL